MRIVDLIAVYFDQSFNVMLFVNKWIIILIIALIVFGSSLVNKLKDLKRELEIDEAEIGIGKGKIKLKPNYKDKQIAYQLWVELSTRKIGLPVDFRHDFIIDIYRSWYEFFKLTRQLIKVIPVSKIKNHKSTKQLVNIAVAVLNTELRPHLTRHYARYTRWYEVELKKHEGKHIAPQDIQKKYPKYREVIKDIKKINNRMTKYRELLEEISIN